ncbi:branched-chain amino acid transport system II carrier protein [Evansella cellulosilytica]|uniref:Branched-chain amino acid transport system carrier protein n=1 Tax=Evansella cellulosilytica (strain ATCC 21833 / DSM 2522 / FERM P-1141 / JCM 9156 / N-4) TaxID=649639 RepID=E6U152_EVAC2|nr:branched-chain amino acid transport system II carrier protein [Evansella cellulosilytica]ADU31498.1 branched-chain amino acid transport system II carrier protein [Evansella cellulosilytica DSM 2522]
MRSNSYSIKDTIIIGLMLFALFLGAGNLIFPPALGQAAGTNVSFAIIGFLITGVGLPILAILAIAKSGGDLQKVSSNVGTLFSIFFPLAVYLAIGPLFGIPRTGSVAYEIGLLPYLESTSTFTLFIFTFAFFGVSFWLSLNPSKLVNRIGKLLTPIIIGILLLLTVVGIIKPMGSLNLPSPEYVQYSFFKGFQEGYFTMDAIASLVFGIVVITRMRERGIHTLEDTKKKAIQVGLIAGLGLIFVYLSLAYLGATSIDSIGYLDNGGAILANISNHLLGFAGLILLSIVITIACLTTSVGLISAFGEFIQRTIPAIPYPVTTGTIALFSFAMANMGLNQLIQFSLPMLMMLYPIAIVLIILTLCKDLLRLNKGSFQGGVIGAAIVSIPDGLSQTTIFSDVFLPFMQWLPFGHLGIGWIIPAIFGTLLGKVFTKK